MAADLIRRVRSFPVPDPRGGLALVAKTFQDERAQWPLWWPVIFGTGIGLYFALPVEPPLWLAGLAALIAWMAYMVTPSGLGLRIGAAGLLILALGFAGACLRTAQVAEPVLAKRTRSVTVTGWLERVELRDNGSQRLLIRVERIDGIDQADTPYRVRVSVRQKTTVSAPGAAIRVRAVLQPPPGPAAPGAFDFARQAWFQRLGAVGYAVAAPEETRGAPLNTVAARIGRFRQTLSLTVREALPGREGAIAAAVITGDRAGIAQEDWTALRDAGLAHLLAISGLHMTAIAFLVFGVVRAGLALVESIALTRPVKKWAAVATIMGAACYLIISGASVSTQRAFIMVLIAMGAILFDRPAISLRTVAVAALVILVLKPESLVHAGFQMSFGAVTALISVYEMLRQGPLRGWWEGNGVPPGLARRMAMGLVGVAVTTLIASLATAPFAAFHFNRMGQLDVLANLVAVPLFSFLVMPMALATLLAMPLGLEAWPLWIMGQGIQLILTVAHDVAAWPVAARTVAAWPWGALVLMVMGGLWLMLWRKPWRFAGLVPMIMGLIIAVAARPPDLLVDRRGKLVAIRDEGGGLMLSHGRRERFSAQVWLRRDGDGRTPRAAAARTSISPDETSKGLSRWDGPQEGTGGWQCDDLGCVQPAALFGRVALGHDDASVAEDCAKADILIHRTPIRGDCPNPRLIVDIFDLAFGGPVALWRDEDGFTLRTARHIRGERPWVQPRRQPYHRPRERHPPH